MFIKSRQKGFTLIEALVALVILSTALVPLLALSNRSTSLAASIRNNLVASNLAQEGSEVVRNLRDQNWVNGLAFDAGLADCGQATCNWRVQWNSTVPIALGANPPLLFDAATSLYGYTAGNPSIYTRTVSIARSGAAHMVVTSTVSWPERGRTTLGCASGYRCIKVETHLFDWK